MHQLLNVGDFIVCTKVNKYSRTHVGEVFEISKVYPDTNDGVVYEITNGVLSDSLTRRLEYVFGGIYFVPLCYHELFYGGDV